MVAGQGLSFPVSTRTSREWFDCFTTEEFAMNKSTVAKMIAAAVQDAMRFVNAETPVAVAAPAKAADDVQARRLAGLEKARAAKKAKAQARAAAAAVAAPVAAVAKPVVKPAKQPAAAWTVKPHVTAKGVKGKIVTVGPFNAWVEEGDTEKEKALFDAINKVFRSDEAVKLAAAITG